MYTVTQQRKKRILKEGFSLIEIMIVILIIGVLAAGAFVGFRLLKQARESATNTTLANLDAAIEMYNTRLGEYPTDLHELVEGPQKPNLQRKWGEPLADEKSLKDAWGHDIVYQLNPKGAIPPYELYSIGSTGTAKIYSPVSREAGTAG